jgi:GNAT superfamily N-acetyltransferase
VNVVVPYQDQHLFQLAELVNAHVASAMPGWWLPADVLAARLRRNPGEDVIDPWVEERRTLVALERERVVAAAHLHRYAAEERVGPSYRGAGELVWLMAWPDREDAGRAVLTAVDEVMAAWGIERPYGPEGLGGLYLPGLGGIPDAWPHLAALLRAAGFAPDPERTERLYGGDLDGVPGAGSPPIAGLEVRRRVANLSTRFAAELEGRGAGAFDVATGVGEHLRTWADVWNLNVAEELRGRGVGTWLVADGVAWLRLAGCDRIALSVTLDDEAAGAGRFYERLGWRPLATVERAWRREG